MRACLPAGAGVWKDPVGGQGRAGRVRRIAIMRMERMLAGDAAAAAAMASGDVAANLVNAQYEGITNFPIVAAFLSFFVAQSLKVLTTWYFRLRHFLAPPPDLSLSPFACSTSGPATQRLYATDSLFPSTTSFSLTFVEILISL